MRLKRLVAMVGGAPTGLLAALTYFSAAKIRDTYLKSAGPLVQA